jgi:hypothetical protein
LYGKGRTIDFAPSGGAVPIEEGLAAKTSDKRLCTGCKKRYTCYSKTELDWLMKLFKMWFA